MTRVCVATIFTFCFAVLASRPLPAQAQAPTRTPEEAAVRARNIARTLEDSGRRLTLYDRQGKVLQTIGERGMYTQPVLAPDKTRVAVIKNDLESETTDVWLIDVRTSLATRVTSSKTRENVASPVWSPDGRYLAWAALRGSHYGIYRRLANGQGQEELLHEHPGGAVNITDWSVDGRFLSYSINDLSGSTIYLLPLDGPREPIIAARSTSQLVASRLSPDNRLIAYRSNESGRNEIWVRAVPPTGQPDAPVRTWQVSKDGGLGMMFWRQDGRELYYLAADRGIMAVPVSTATGFEFGAARRLFAAPATIPVTGIPGAFGNVSRDGERVLFAVPPPPPLRQIVVFDRSGRIVTRVGEPALYGPLALSPDGSKVAVARQDAENGTSDIWSIDIATGRATAVTSDPPGENAPLWSSDGRHVAYVATRGTYSAIYRKAADGSGPTEMLFRYTPGAGMALTDLSADGRFLTFNGGGLIGVVALTGDDPLKRPSVDFARSEFNNSTGRFSPDGRFVAFLSNEIGDRSEVFVQRFDAVTGGAADNQKWQVSKEGAIGGIAWREDGRELYYLSGDRLTGEATVMAADIETSPNVKMSAPRPLFRLSSDAQIGNVNISADGQRFVFVVRAPRAADVR